MRHRRRRSALRDPAELNITAFMNLMVVLVPFLLITAVFSRITILELNLPAGTPAAEMKVEQEFALEIILRDDALEVNDRGSGPIRRIANKDGRHDLAALGELLQQIKAQFPEKSEATILAEGTTRYDALVQVMDTVRVVEVPQGETVLLAELFPEISIGDAPQATPTRP